MSEVDDLRAHLRAQLTSANNHLAAKQERIAGLERSVNDLSARIAAHDAERDSWAAAGKRMRAEADARIAKLESKLAKRDPLARCRCAECAPETR